eukprot:SAG22_NODE_2199_length_2847_cov_1.666667_2_plen_80_part_00
MTELQQDGVPPALLASEAETGAAGVARLLREVPLAFPVPDDAPPPPPPTDALAGGGGAVADHALDVDDHSDAGDYLDVS